LHAAVGIEAEGDKIELLIKELDGKDVNEVIAEGALPRHPPVVSWQQERGLYGVRVSFVRLA